MKYFLRILATLCIVLLDLHAKNNLCEPVENFIQIPSNGLITLEKNTTINIKYMQSESKIFQNNRWWGTEGASPKKLIFSFFIKTNQHTISLPFSAYFDLVNLWGIKYEKHSDGFDLILRGAQTAFSYQVIYIIKNGYLAERTIISCEFPNELWEQTTYSWILDHGQ